jgi:hypothetical protein
VPARDPEALAAAIGRFFGDAELRGRLIEAAAPSVEDSSEEAVFGVIEAELERATR